MHQLSSEKMSFSMAICHKCLEHPVVFPADLFFFEATCISCFRQYPSAEVPGYEVFSHPSWEFKHFFGRFQSFALC